MHTEITLPQFFRSARDTEQFLELKKRVYRAVNQLPQGRQHVARHKAWLLPTLYCCTYAAALMTKHFLAFCLAYCIMGLLLVIIFLNLVHEACHQNLFADKKWNRIYLLLFDLIGANSYMWKRRHVRLHHNYPNVIGWDSDIEQCHLLKVHPQDRRKTLARYQHLLIVLYPLFIANWFLIRDFKDFFNSGMTIRKLGNPPLAEYGKLFFFKLFFIGYVVVAPMLVTPFSGMEILFSFFLMLFSAGLFALIVLLPPHVNTGNAFPCTNEQLQLKQSWLTHQLSTTNDVIMDNWFSRHVLANCNYHVAHHLFSNISYWHAKEVTQIVREFSREKGIPYRSYSLLTSFRMHYRLIRHNGGALQIFKEDM